VTSRLRRRPTISCAFAAAMFALGCGGASAATQDVVSVILHPYLQGTSPLVATRVPRLWHGPGTVISLASVENAIPDPLPLSPPQPVCRRVAQRITVVNSDGERATYGPCVVPESISNLARAMNRVALRNATRQAAVSVVVDPYFEGKSPLVATRAPRSWPGRGTVISCAASRKQSHTHCRFHFLNRLAVAPPRSLSLHGGDSDLRMALVSFPIP
jgi:hypothetical protein